MPEVIDAPGEDGTWRRQRNPVDRRHGETDRHQPFHGLRYEGTRFDCGNKIGYLEAQIAFALKRPDLADAVRGFLTNTLSLSRASS